jgi:phospholipid/cholesterol/gamma-HCH transport system substrate-binding protein
MSERESAAQIRVGAFVLAAIILFVIFVLTVGSRTQIFQSVYPLRAYFGTVQGLIEGAPVRLGGYTVGHVSRIGFGSDLGDKRVVVDLALDPRFSKRLREDSVATIATIGLVGDKYVEVTVGSPDRKILPASAVIHSIDPWDYAQLMQKGEQIMASVSKLATAVEEFLGGTGKEDTRRNLSAIIESVRSALAEVEHGRGLVHRLLYDPKSAALVDDISRTAGAVTDAGQGLARVAGSADAAVSDVQAVLKEVREGRGLLHALVYDKSGAETLERLARTAGALEDLMREAREGKGLLRALIYDPEGAETLRRLARAGQAVEDLARQAHDGPGLLHALVADPKGGRLLDDLAGAAADVKKVTAKLAGGEGTLGALLDDPTLYEDLSTLFRGAERSWILRAIIRSGLKRGADPKP